MQAAFNSKAGTKDNRFLKTAEVNMKGKQLCGRTLAKNVAIHGDLTTEDIIIGFQYRFLLII